VTWARALARSTETSFTPAKPRNARSTLFAQLSQVIPAIPMVAFAVLELSVGELGMFVSSIMRLALKAGEGPEAADAEDVAVDADALLLWIERGVAFGLGGEGIVVEKKSALETGFFKIGEAAADMA
jgi:ABC-type uncharacterized transport system permease subunit